MKPPHENFLRTPLFHNAFAFYLDPTNLGIGALLRSSIVTSVAD